MGYSQLELVPVNAGVDEAENVAEGHRKQWQQVVETGAVRQFQPSTMIVMMMAMTPSLIALMRDLPI